MAVTINEVLADSACGKAGILPGDRLISINGHEIADELDLRFRAAEGPVQLTIYRSHHGLIRKTVFVGDEDVLGLGLTEFKAKACNNKCVFCFVDQLPPGVRGTLKFKDDDFRLSFLHGNYLTLTNLSEAEIERIIAQRLTPLYVSVHATDLMVRARMLGRPMKHCSLEPMLRLVHGGIEIHAQVVLCPGINDGNCLENTIQELEQHYPGLASVAIVPLGTSQFRANLADLIEVTPSYCLQIIQQVHRLQKDLRRRLGVTFAYLADEFYLQAGYRLPESESYDDFALLEDGIGMLRHFEREFRRVIRRKSLQLPEAPDCTLVTGKLFYPFLSRYARQIQRRLGGRLRVVSVENRFLGTKITVAGLLAGRDIAETLKNSDLGRFVIVPGECLAMDAQVFLDNMSKDQLASALRLEVRDTSRSVQGFFKALGGNAIYGDVYQS